jgi:wyosine [tRNA(Phe)-imidazoG37] synthetase (radical SAM superfamily)
VLGTDAEGAGSARISKLSAKLEPAFRRHDRLWRANRYVYPVISRRSHGLSIGVNLNPDKACNFDCVYCQVDRTVPPLVRRVDLRALESELLAILDETRSGRLFEGAPFDLLPPENRFARDIAFSGDGEPTTFPRFGEAVEIAARARRQCAVPETKLVLITDAAYLDRPKVREALQVLDENNGEIWAKLDAGTEEYFQAVDRPNVSLRVVVRNILEAARARPVIIQSLWLKLNGVPPSWGEIDAYCERLDEVLRGGGQLKNLQLYTIARIPAEGFVAPLANAELDAIAARVRERVPVQADVYYEAG